MERLTRGLVLYQNFDRPEGQILARLCRLFARFHAGESQELVGEVHGITKAILDVSTDYGFDENLWQCYLTWFLIMNENSFSLTCERRGPGDGSVDELAKRDFAIFQTLFHFDFSELEEALGVDDFSILTDYRAIAKSRRMYNRSVSEHVTRLRRELCDCRDREAFFAKVTSFYEAVGVGIWSTSKAFRIRDGQEDQPFIFPVRNTDDVVLSDLVGYEIQKKKLMENTESFVSGKPANNCLLYGDAGTGKSTSIKAILNQYAGRGLRMIEVYRHQMRSLSRLIAEIKTRNYFFIIYMDDLSFEDFETDYKYLKAVIEGGVEQRPDNVLIYATSNRRHLIRENWSDRSDMDTSQDIHRSDTMQEKLSLYQRFGVSIAFGRPMKKEFYEIVRTLAARDLKTAWPEDELFLMANQWEMSHGGATGRCARQFIDHLAGLE